MSDNNDYNFDSTGLLAFLYQWRKQLIVLSVLAAVTSSIISLVIDEKYKSTVIVFPASTSSVSKALLSQNASGKHDVMEFGEEEEAEQLLQVLNSDEIRVAIIEKYDLLNHYEIEGDYIQTKLMKTYANNISFKRTKFQSVRIDVLDISRDTAAYIANDIAMLLDSALTRMEHERATLALSIVKYEFDDLVSYIESMEDSMTVIRKLGVHEYEVQIEMFTKAYSEALSAGNKSAAASLEEKLDILATYGSAYVSLRNKIEYETEKMILLRGKLKEAEVDAKTTLPHKFIVNNAFPAEKKSYPIRWLIVVISTLSTFLMTVVAIVAYDSFKKINVTNN
jgi:LPS O-antigen subunit length determinant protein (WzzB/FepE family)